MEIANLIVPPVIEGLKCSFLPLKRQIGYIFHCKKKFEKLKENFQKLKETRDDVQQRVTAAQKNLESIHKVVEAWLVKVDKETSTADGDGQTNILGLVMNGEAVNMVNAQCWCSCCDSGSRYNLGKRAAKKLFILDELIKEGQSFNHNVSDPSFLGMNLMPTNNQDIEPFATREQLRDKVMEALQDEGTNFIGVYGMGGVGKTTLVNQVFQKVKEHNLFDDVVMTTISQNVDIKQIQNDLADMLGLKQLKTMDSERARAGLLSERLKQKRSLVILDDLWSNLNFFHVGIPCGENHHKGCKVIITTRRLKVCTSLGLGSEKNFNVAVLSEEDSWQLFKKMNVGDLAYSPVLEKTAKEVAKECGGLPVALVTLGRAMRNKNKSEWDNTLLELKKSNIMDIDEIDGNVYSSIKLSYDYLGNEILKKCFLFCCLFPEDDEIYIYDLIGYLMDDDWMFDDEETLKEKADRLHTVLEKLVDSCLLLVKTRADDGTLSVVTMHDIIRDVAIKIASQEGNGFLVKAGVHLKYWPNIGKGSLSSGGTSKCVQLSLMKNEISVLPNDPPELPRLLSLSLHKNRSLTEIPDSYFQRMGSLAALNLTQTDVLFPKSHFPADTKNHCEISVSPPVCDSIKVLIQRVKSLTLKICSGLKSVGQLGHDFNHLNRISVSSCNEMEYIMTMVEAEVVPFRCFENLETLKVSECDKLRYLFTPSMASNLQNLKELQIIRCKSMEKLISTDDDQLLLIIFPNLEVLEIEYCENLNQLWGGNNNLEKEDDHHDANDQLASAGQASTLNFHHLVYLRVVGCKNLKRIHLTHKCTLKLKQIVGGSEEWFQGLEWEDPRDKLYMRTLFSIEEEEYRIEQPFMVEEDEEEEEEEEETNEIGATGLVLNNTEDTINSQSIKREYIHNQEEEEEEEKEEELGRIQKGKNKVVEEPNEIGANEEDRRTSEVGTSAIRNSEVETSKVKTSEIANEEMGTSKVRNTEIGTSKVRTYGIESRDDEDHVSRRGLKRFTGDDLNLPHSVLKRLDRSSSSATVGDADLSRTKSEPRISIILRLTQIGSQVNIKFNCCVPLHYTVLLLVLLLVMLVYFH